MARRTSSSRSRALSSSRPDTDALHDALQQAFPDERWLDVLEVFLPTGVADSKQIQSVTGLSYDQLKLTLDQFHRLADKGIVARVPFAVKRPGVRGRPPTVYTLGKAGAALLRANGYDTAHACGLKEETSIAHARGTLDVRLKALEEWAEVQTEKELPFVTTEREERVLRPDNVVAVTGGGRAIFETEQAATLRLLKRITKSVQGKAAFFRSEAAQDFSPTVRVLINLPYGKAWNKTVATWERATAIVADEHRGELGFNIVALPLQAFLDAPDWDEPPDGKRWESLFDPAQTATFAPPALAEKEKQEAKRSTRRKLPKGLKRRTAVDDRRVMLAYYQHLLENGPELAYTAATPQADPEFFEVMTVIYAASHPPDRTPWEEVKYPYASIYLLRKYLQMHPQLKGALSKGMSRGGGRMTWNVTNILHRMQVIIDTFLRYHGLRNSRSLAVTPVSSWDRKDSPQDYGIMVRTRAEVLMGDRDGVVPARDEVQATEKALAWVLWALFSYSEVLGIRRPGFW